MQKTVLVTSVTFGTTIIEYSELLVTSSAENVTSLDYSDDNRFNFVLNQLCTPAIFGTITLIGLTGNSLVLYAILSRDRMRTVTNLLLLNLAVADLGFVVIVPPFTAYQYATDSWPFGSVVCRLFHYLTNVIAYVTVYTLVVIAMVRYITVVHGTRTARFRTRSNAVLAIVCLWLVTAAVNVPILLAYGENGSVECVVNNVDVGRRIFTTFFLFAYICPLTIIGLFSAAIVRYMTKHGRHSHHRTPPPGSGSNDVALCKTGNAQTSMVTSLAETSAHARGLPPSRAEMASGRRRKQVGRMLLIVVALFAILWLPVHLRLLVFFCWGQIDHRFYEVATVVMYCLAYANSCVNPFIYNYTSKEFRDAFRNACHCNRFSRGQGLERDGERTLGQSRDLTMATEQGHHQQRLRQQQLQQQHSEAVRKSSAREEVSEAVGTTLHLHLTADAYLTTTTSRTTLMVSLSTTGSTRLHEMSSQSAAVTAAAAADRTERSVIM